MNFVSAGICKYRQHQQHAEREHEDGAELHERAEVIARREQQPHRQDAGGKGVDDDRPRQCWRAHFENCFERGVFGDELPAPHRQQQQCDADDGTFQHFADAHPAQVAAHEQRNRNRRGDGEDSPRRFGERVHDHEREHGEQDDHDRENRDHADDAGRGVQFLPHHLRERFAIAPHGRKENDEILHRAAEHHADQNPKRAGQIAELRRQHRTDQRARPRDGREVMPEDDPLVRLHEIFSVVVNFAGRRAAVVQRQHARGDPFGIKTIANGVSAEGRDENVCGIDRLTALEREGGIRARAKEDDQKPQQNRRGSFHGRGMKHQTRFKFQIPNLTLQSFQRGRRPERKRLPEHGQRKNGAEFDLECDLGTGAQCLEFRGSPSVPLKFSYKLSALVSAEARRPADDFSMTTTLTAGEESQLLQTIEMFEVITQSQPQDYQSLEILKEAYLKLGREEELVNTSRRIAEAYVHLGQLSSAILEYESILQRRPDDAGVLAALGEIESKASSLSSIRSDD